jgi:hypothetical protein
MSVPSLSAQIQGQGTVSADNLNTYVQGVQMSSQLRAFTGLPGMTVALQGITEPDDGFGGFFFWSPNGTAPDDNMNVIVPYGVGAGEWVRYTIGAFGGILNFFQFTVSSAVVAAGTSQSTATLLTSQVNNVTSVPAGSGVILPTNGLNRLPIIIGTPIIVYNRGGAGTLSVYPQTGFQIETLGTNNPSGIVNNGNATFTLITPTTWLVS